MEMSRSRIPSVNIRDAVESDAPAILKIQKLAFQKQGMLYNDFKLPPLVQTLEEMLQDFTKYSYLIAVDADKIVGSVRGDADGTTCRISRLFVHPDRQNRGIGKMLMHAVERKFRDADRYELFTGHKSAKNLALYDRLGYRKFAEKPEGANVILFCMEKKNR